jgi:nucleotide-binding universal stress UspA family protein
MTVMFVLWNTEMGSLSLEPRARSQDAEPLLHAPPRTLLLATDLTARCDRALERALMLAQGWQSRLVAVHALEQSEETSRKVMDDPMSLAPRLKDMLHRACLRLQQDILPMADKGQAVAVPGKPIEAVTQAAESFNCDFIVTGIGRDEMLTRLGLRRTMEKLVTRLGVPVLTVRGLVKAPYKNILVAADLSDASRRALQTAASLFPAQPLNVLHVYESPLPGGLAEGSREWEQYRQSAMREMTNLVAGRRGAIAPSLNLLVRQGWPGEVIRQHVLNHDIDLVILGAHDRGALADLIFGSTAADVLGTLPCDILIVGRREMS